MKTYVVYMAGQPPISIEGDRVDYMEGALVIKNGLQEVARFAPGGWLAVIDRATLAPPTTRKP